MRIAILLFICLVPLSGAFAGTSLPTCAQDDVRWYDRKHQSQMDDGQKNALAARASMERIRKKIEEWGLVTISAPVAVMDASKFSLGGDADFPKIQDYMEKARTGLAASIAELDEQAFSDRGALIATPNVPGASTTTIASSLNPTGATAPTSVTVSSNLSSQTFAPLGKLLLNTPSQISERQALSIAAGDKMTENLYRVMGQNNQIPGFNIILFAVIEVSCNPGWRTQENYIADCTAFAEYFDRERNLPIPRCENRQPTIFSVLPLIDAQTIEMSNSQRQMSQLAANLSAAFPGQAANLQANDILEFVKRSQRDAVSRKPVPVVNTYSTGKIMGFRFSPSFQAMKDPAVRKSGAANVLLPTAFPALVTLVIHQEDLKAAKRFAQGNEPCLMTHISTRWFLKDRPPLVAWYRRLWTPMKRETSYQRIDMAMDVGEMYHYYNEAQKAYADAPMFDPVMEELHRDTIELEDKVIGQSWPIPMSKQFQDALAKTALTSQSHNISLASPNTIKDGATQLIEFAGEGLQDVDTVQMGGVASTVAQYQKNTGTLKAVFVNFHQTPSASEQAAQDKQKTATQVTAADAKFTTALTAVSGQVKALSGDVDKASSTFVAVATALPKTPIPTAAATALLDLASIKSEASGAGPALDAAKAASLDDATKALDKVAAAINKAIPTFASGLSALGTPADLATTQKVIDANAASATLSQDATALSKAETTLKDAAAAAAKLDAQSKAAAPPASQTPSDGAAATTTTLSITITLKDKTSYPSAATVTLQKDSTSNPAPKPPVTGSSPGADATPNPPGLFPGGPDLELTAQLPTTPATSTPAPKRLSKSSARVAVRQSAH